jgi:hypothetical protein
MANPAPSSFPTFSIAPASAASAYEALPLRRASPLPLIFGLWLVPYRLLRRGARKRKAEAKRHRELLATLEAQKRE